jgi:hypothetical protein
MNDQSELIYGLNPRLVLISCGAAVLLSPVSVALGPFFWCYIASLSGALATVIYIKISNLDESKEIPLKLGIIVGCIPGIMFSSVVGLCSVFFGFGTFLKSGLPDVIMATSGIFSMLVISVLLGIPNAISGAIVVWVINNINQQNKQ